MPTGNLTVAGVPVGGPVTGWELVERSSAEQIEAGKTTAEHYRLHLEGPGGPGRKSWVYYATWKREHPGEDVPAEINRVRTDFEFDAWAAAGMPMDPRKAARAQSDAYYRRESDRVARTKGAVWAKRIVEGD